MPEEQNQNTNDNDNNPVTNPTPEESGLLLDGFKRVEARVRAVPSKECEQINLDIPSAVATVIGAYPEIISLRPALEGLKTFNMSDVDSLRDYGCALGHAHAEYRATAGVVDNVGALAAECIEIRVTLPDRERLLHEAWVVGLDRAVERTKVNLGGELTLLWAPSQGSGYRLPDDQCPQ